MSLNLVISLMTLGEAGTGGGEETQSDLRAPLFPGSSSPGEGCCSGPVLPAWELGVGAQALWSSH